MVDKTPNRFDIWLVLKQPDTAKVVDNLGLCAVVSPDELNNLNTRIIIPMTTVFNNLPSRVKCTFNNSKTYIMIDQIRVINNNCFVNKLGSLEQDVRVKLCNRIEEFFTL